MFFKQSLDLWNSGFVTDVLDEENSGFVTQLVDNIEIWVFPASCKLSVHQFDAIEFGDSLDSTVISVVSGNGNTETLSWELLKKLVLGWIRGIGVGVRVRKGFPVFLRWVRCDFGFGNLEYF